MLSCFSSISPLSISMTSNNNNGEWKGLLAPMQQNLSTEEEILSDGCSNSCCIYRAPRNLMDIKGQSYQPQIVSIGPYHHGQPHLQMIEEHKWRFLSLLLDRIQAINLTLEDLLKAVQPLESAARDCYSETILYDHNQLIEILVLDGCFMIELLRKGGELVPFEAEDPLTTMSWISFTFLRDLIQLENQIPFFVLDCLFKLTQMPGEEDGSLTMLTLDFFNGTLERPDNVIAKYRDLQGKHILDLLRSSFTHEICSEVGEEGECRVNVGCLPMVHATTTGEVGKGRGSSIIHCVSKLQSAGIKLKPGQEDSFLSIKYNPGVIKMPKIAIDDLMREFLVNCVAYEQCHNMIVPSLAHMTAYVVFLDCLIHKSSDNVEYLCKENIIENCLGSDDEAAKFIHDLRKNVAFEEGYLASLFDGVNKYYDSKYNYWQRQMVSFKNSNCSTPLSSITTMAAFILLVYTVFGTINTMLD